MRISAVTFFYRNNNKNEKKKTNIFIRLTRASFIDTHVQFPSPSGNSELSLQQSGSYFMVVIGIAVVVVVVVSAVVVETVVTSSVLLDEYVVEFV
jgi:hypothetical protein